MSTRGEELVSVTFLNDRAPEGKRLREVTVAEDLASLFSYSHQWSEYRSDECSLTFSGMLAAMMASDKPLCRWLQEYLALRGAEPLVMTGGRSYGPAELDAPLKTTGSFRNAFEVAEELAATTGAGGVAVRHFMAAYAVVPGYHLDDFVRLRVDRRAWCLGLAGELTGRYPDERDAWQAYAERADAVVTPGFNADTPDGRDLLNVEREVEAFSRVIAARSTATPLSIGVFGAWGSGKSFFMRRLRERVAAYAAAGRAAGRESLYHGRVAQVSFNAWHYSEGNLVASLVEHVFSNLTLDAEDEDDAAIRQRGAELLDHLQAAEGVHGERERAAAVARARLGEAQRAVDAIVAGLPDDIAAAAGELEAAEADVREAERALAARRERMAEEIDAEVRRSAARAVLATAAGGLVDAKMVEARDGVLALAKDARRTGARWKPILIGAGLLAVGAVATAAVHTELYAELVSASAAVGAFAAMARSWLRKLDEVAERAERYEAERTKIQTAAAARIEESYRPSLERAEAALEAREEVARAKRAALEDRTRAPDVARGELADRAAELKEALQRRAEAAADVEDAESELARLGAQTRLAAFLDTLTASDSYRKELGIFSRVRNDFDRLSRLMAKAADEYYNGTKPEPTVSRIVLYVDDLDRCPEEKVVEVLRVVHLMLASPLFVCVVAVDPRWVTTSLWKAPGLIEHALTDRPVAAAVARATDGLASLAPQQLDATMGESATPSDYLEKIFQIPLWLRPVPVVQRPAVVRALLDPGRTRAGGGSGGAIHAPIVAAAQSPSEGEEPRPAVSSVSVDEVELDYLESIEALLNGNPRTLKRFVNTYRLVKSALSEVELQVFTRRINALTGKFMTGGPTVEQPCFRPYRLCMTQLAVLCTQRTRALALVRHADSRAPSDPLGPWLVHLEKDQPVLSRHLRAVFEPRGANLDEVQMALIQQWLERTRRYSFYL